jgi:hypothetical protein
MVLYKRNLESMKSKLRLPRKLLALLYRMTAATFIYPVPTLSQSSPAGQSNTSANPNLAGGRRVVEQAEVEWARALVRVDKETFERMLAPEFYAQLPNRRLSREECIKRVSKRRPRIKTNQVDNRVLTIKQEGDTYGAQASNQF